MSSLINALENRLSITAAVAIFIGSAILLFAFIFLARCPGAVVLAFDSGIKMPSDRETSVKICSPAEAAKYAHKVIAMKDKWETKYSGVLYTLGKPSYLGNVRKGSGATNEEMQENFGELIQLVKAEFERRYPDHDVIIGGGDVAPKAGTPGFHIFTPSALSKLPVASLHVDMQYYDAGFTDRRGYYPGKTLSYTLLLGEPEGGAGLHLWDVSPYIEEPDAAHIKSTVAPFVTPLNLLSHRDKHKYLEYKVGYMETHGGNLFHLIAPFSHEATKPRITLQGHGFFCEEDKPTLYLYW